MPAFQHPVALTPEEAAPLAGVAALVGRHYPVPRALRAGAGGLSGARVGTRAGTASPIRAVRARVAGPGVWGEAKLKIYSGAPLSLNLHHPMNDVVGVNIRTFELAAAGACQVVDLKDDLGALFKPGEEVVAFRDLGELRRQLDYYLAHPDEARAIGANARRRALAEHTLRHRLEEIAARRRGAARAPRMTEARRLRRARLTGCPWAGPSTSGRRGPWPAISSGCVLVSRCGGAVTSGRIVETEAYLGPDDAASHAAFRPGSRALFYGPGGMAYVFRAYGLHDCLNAIAGRVGQPGCVLIRALEPLEGAAVMARAPRCLRGLAPARQRARATSPGRSASPAETAEPI